MAINRLSAMTVAKVSAKGFYPDGGGLSLQVTQGANGPRKSWVYRFTSPETRRERFMGLGAYPEISLAAARAKRDEARAIYRERLDPIEERERLRSKAAVAKAKGMNFDQCAAAYISANAPSWGARKHRIDWENSLARYASPILGALPVEAIDVGLVLKVLEPLWQEKPPLANRLRGKIETILSWAIARQLRSGPNPAQWKANLDHILPAVRKFHQTVHHRALPYRELPQLMERLRVDKSTAARAMMFLILTASRVSEVAQATWSEIDLDARIWTVIPEHMKTKRFHRVPLVGPAMTILEAVAPPREGLIFPSAKVGHSMTDMTFTAVLERYGANSTTHGLRSSFADWGHETTEFPRELVEASLAHAIGDKVEQSYRRSDAIERRRRLMDAWASFVCGEPRGQVIKLQH